MFSNEIINFDEKDIKEWAYWEYVDIELRSDFTDEQIKEAVKLVDKQYSGLKHAYTPDYLLERCEKSVRQAYYSRKYKGMLIDKQKRKKKK